MSYGIEAYCEHGPTNGLPEWIPFDSKTAMGSMYYPDFATAQAAIDRYRGPKRLRAVEVMDEDEAMDLARPKVVGIHTNAVEHLTRELDRRGKVIEAVQIWRQQQEAEYNEGMRRDAARRLKNAIDEYTRETLRLQEQG